MNANGARFENLEALGWSRPAALSHLRPENHRGDLPLHFLDDGIGRAAAADDDSRTHTLRAVEAYRHVEVVHRETNRRAILDKLGVDHARKCGRQIHVASGHRQNDLLGRNPPNKRRKLEVQASDGISKFIDI